MDGGKEGLDVIKKVIYKSKTILKKLGLLALEIGHGQHYKVSQILKKQGFKEELLIKAIETVDGDGKYTDNVKLFEGLHIFKSNPIVI